MYYIEFENKIPLADIDINRLKMAIVCNPQYSECEILETDKILAPCNGEYIFIDSHEYKEEEIKKRKNNFENNFLSTPLGNYRLQPKGYANAQQSIDTVNALATMLGGLNETLCNMVIFYATPDFSKPEECTEAWLVQHQSHPEPMTLQQWAEFYITFSTLYAQKMYKVE